MNENYMLVKLRDNDTMNDKVSEWFHQKWGIPIDAYRESIIACQRLQTAIPQWYVLMDGERIIAGMGVIENDFHVRRDLSPNICAVFTEEEYRGQGLAKYLLDYICGDLSRLGYNEVYLLTSHTDLYEKCGFEFFCHVKEDQGSTARMYRRISKCGASFVALKNFVDNEGRLTAFPSKRKMKLHALIYLSEKLIKGKLYTEKEINSLLNEWHTYADPATLRRELCDHKILSRDSYGKEYQLYADVPSFEDLERIYG